MRLKARAFLVGLLGFASALVQASEYDCYQFRMAGTINERAEKVLNPLECQIAIQKQQRQNMGFIRCRDRDGTPRFRSTEFSPFGMPLENYYVNGPTRNSVVIEFSSLFWNQPENVHKLVGAYAKARGLDWKIGHGGIDPFRTQIVLYRDPVLDLSNGKESWKGRGVRVLTGRPLMPGPWNGPIGDDLAPIDGEIQYSDRCER